MKPRCTHITLMAGSTLLLIVWVQFEMLLHYTVVKTPVVQLPPDSLMYEPWRLIATEYLSTRGVPLSWVPMHPSILRSYEIYEGSQVPQRIVSVSALVAASSAGAIGIAGWAWILGFGILRQGIGCATRVLHFAVGVPIIFLAIEWLQRHAFYCHIMRDWDTFDALPTLLYHVGGPGLLLFTFVAALRAWSIALYRRSRHDLCNNCGYSVALIAPLLRCPECGNAIGTRCAANDSWCRKANDNGANRNV